MRVVLVLLSVVTDGGRRTGQRRRGRPKAQMEEGESPVLWYNHKRCWGEEAALRQELALSPQVLRLPQVRDLLLGLALGLARVPPQE